MARADTHLTVQVNHEHLPFPESSVWVTPLLPGQADPLLPQPVGLLTPRKILHLGPRQSRDLGP